MTTESSRTAKEDIGELLEQLFAKPEEESSKPHNIWHCLYNQRSRQLLEPLQQVSNLVVPPEVDLTITFDAAFRKAEEIFHQFYPDEEFIPLVPNPEDVVFVPFPAFFICLAYH